MQNHASIIIFKSHKKILDDYKHFFRKSSLGGAIMELIKIYEEIEKLNFILSREKDVIKVDGVEAIKKFKDGWTLKSLDWSKLMEKEDGNKKTN